MHTTFHLGAFTGSGKLAAYIELVRMGELGIINRILGHKDHLPNGVMNGLVHFMVTWSLQTASLQTASLQTASIREVNYLTLNSATMELDRFKRSVGFVPKTLTLRQS